MFDTVKYTVIFSSVQFSCSVVSDSLHATARQASLSITNSRSSLKLMPIDLVIPSSHLILCRPLLLLPPIPPNIMAWLGEFWALLYEHVRWMQLCGSFLNLVLFHVCLHWTFAFVVWWCPQFIVFLKFWKYFRYWYILMDKTLRNEKKKIIWDW